MEKVAGVLDVRLADDAEAVVIHHPDLRPDANGAVRIVLTPRHARHLSSLLLIRAEEAEKRQSILASSRRES
jgi:hypothetical protein